MDLSKLKLEKYTSFLVKNFPPRFPVEKTSQNTQVEVILYFVDKIGDVEDFVRLCRTVGLGKDNRVILVYEKGRRDGVNRDAIFLPFHNPEHSDFKQKAPMLCSLSAQLSACVFSLEC